MHSTPTFSPDSKYLITINADGYFSEVTEWNSARADGEQLFYLIPESGNRCNTGKYLFQGEHFRAG